MAYTKKLLSVEYHYDDDTWTYEIWELDFWLLFELHEYANKYGKDKLLTFLKESLPNAVDRFIDE